MRTLVVTAANEAVAPLLRGLVRSLQQWDPLPYTAFACLDVGLEPQSREWVSRHALHVVSPEWDLPVNRRLRETEPHLRALTARPFLPKYFPGYDVYFWIDPDAWEQERFAFEGYLTTAEKGSLTLTTEVDRAYRCNEGIINWRMRRMKAYFGERAARQSLWERYFNAGVFALSSDAPHWAVWAKHFKSGLDAAGGALCCDQTALNHMLWTEAPPLHPLPAVYNWMCHMALPTFDSQQRKFCEPFAPARAIGILHLAGGSKNASLQIRDGNLSRTISLHFPSDP